LITVAGRVLPPPKVTYSQKKPASVFGGSWNMQSIKFNRGGTLREWGALYISKNGIRDLYDEKGIQAAVTGFYSHLRSMGINASDPGKVRTITVSHYEDPQIENTMKLASQQFRLLLIIIPGPDSVLYKRIKHAGDVKFGMHTICVVGSKFLPGKAQYFANVAVKLNLKIGGTNQEIPPERLGIISENKTMVVGIDVTHPSPGSASNAPSVAGMVASVDQVLGQWPADLRVQESRQEMVSELDAMLISRLRLWKQQGKHQYFPENILVYRDGVSEGQYAIVLEKELPLLRKACTTVYPVADTKKGLPHFTIVVVGKRHHTRFYPTKASDADQSGNPRSGTVVDRGVTEGRNWDFFLQAHAAIKGTARPAHYYVVLDEIFKKRKVMPPFQNAADVLEDLTHNMCYLFGRATKAVSICPPAYYADIVCERARCYLSQFDSSTRSTTPAQGEFKRDGQEEVKPDSVVVHDNLRNTMFYV
jgi:hypothetical protein